MLSIFEEIVLFITIPLVALFVSKYYTYEFSTPKFLILAFASFVLSLYLLCKIVLTAFFKVKNSQNSQKNEVYYSFYITPVHILWLFFGIHSLVSTYNVIRDNSSYLLWSFDISLYLIVNILASYYLTNKITNKKNILWYAALFVVPGFYIGFSSILNYYTGYEPLLGNIGEPLIRGSIKSTVGNVIFVTNYLNMLLPVNIYFLFSKDFHVYGKRKYWKVFLVKLISLISAVMIIIVLSIAQTRSELIALGIGLTIFFSAYFLVFLRKKRSKNENVEEQDKKLVRLTNIFVVLFVLLFVLCFLLFNFYQPLIGTHAGTIVTRFSGEIWSSSKDERMLGWLSTIPIWKRHKLIGQGIGTYKLYDLYGVQEVLKKNPEYNYVWNNFKKAHNEYLQQLSETGIIGFSILLAMLVFLLVYSIKNLYLLEDEDDALLFLSFVISGVVFSLQCVFSFPAQVLPNALAATFFISVGLGPYFNKTNMIKNFQIRKTLALFLLILVCILTGTSTYLRYNHFWAETYFKAGFESFNKYYAYENAISEYRVQIEDLKKAAEELESLSGRFQYLAPEQWHVQKEKEASLSRIPYNKANAELQRIKMIENVKKQLENSKTLIENEINKLESQLMNLFYEAKDYFLKSKNYDPTFGKSTFYLANMATNLIRVGTLKTQLQLEPSTVLRQEYDDYQSSIDNKYKYRYLTFLEDAIKKMPELPIYLPIAEAQALLDSIGLFETALAVFSERNIYKALALRYADLTQHVDLMLRSLNDEEARSKLSNLKQKLIDKFIEWSLAAVTLKPGSWMKFPDWRSVDFELATQGQQDVYRLFSGIAFNLMPLNDKRLIDFLRKLSTIELNASISMEQKGFWGVPDGTFPFLTVSLLKLQDKKMLKQVLETFRPMYEHLKKRIETTKLQDKYKQSLISLKKDIRRILEKELESSKINELLLSFESAMNKAFEGFTSENLENIEQSYVYVLLANEPSAWNQVFRKSIWKTYFNEYISDFKNKIASETISDTTKDSVYKLLNYLTDTTIDNNNFMYVYERMVAFVKFYDIISKQF